jgi:hypothetical protein
LERILVLVSPRTTNAGWPFARRSGACSSSTHLGRGVCKERYKVARPLVSQYVCVLDEARAACAAHHACIPLAHSKDSPSPTLCNFCGSHLQPCSRSSCPYILCAQVQLSRRQPIPNYGPRLGSPRNSPICILRHLPPICRDMGLWRQRHHIRHCQREVWKDWLWLESRQHETKGRQSGTGRVVNRISSWTCILEKQSHGEQTLALGCSIPRGTRR